MISFLNPETQIKPKKKIIHNPVATRFARGDWARREARSRGGGEGEIVRRGAAIAIGVMLQSRSARRQDHDRREGEITIGDDESGLRMIGFGVRRERSVLGGSVLGCDDLADGPNPRLKDPVTALPRELVPRVIEQLYLVESSGALLLVSQEDVQLQPAKEGIDKWIFSNLFPESVEPCLKNSSYGNGTTAFKVFEVNLGGEEWKKLKNLDNRALFLGHNSSVSVKASGFSGCKANCIYFTDNFEIHWSIPCGGGRDTSIYNMIDGSIEPHYPGESLSCIKPPRWVVPSF
uniref:KIB1-4 beta-propeller domain-containing protein n=1 Tax=Quercus lobata TaxID=97700 RepID=A0A7N2REG2_QUELO